MTAKSLINVLYKEAMEKEALRAWKANLGNLSMNGVKKLEDSGILNKTKELKGLNLGTNRILQKSNAKNISNLEHATSIHTENLKKIVPDAFEDEDYTPMVKDQLRATKIFGSPMAPSQTGLSGFTSVPRHAEKHINNITQNAKNVMDQFGMGDTINPPVKIPRKDRESKKWLDAIIRRHEADEVRYGQRIFKDEKNLMDFGNGPTPKSTFFSHMTPKVILNESEHAALAPQRTKQYMTELRNLQGAGSEAPFLKDNMNFDYAKSPVIPKKQRRKINNSYMEYVNDAIKGMED